MEELTTRHGKGIWLREIGKVLKRFDASIEWLGERIAMHEEEVEKIKRDDEMDESEKNKILVSKKAKSIGEVLEDVEALIDAHFFNEFWETKSSQLMRKVIDNQGSIDTNILKRT